MNPKQDKHMELYCDVLVLYLLVDASLGDCELQRDLSDASDVSDREIGFAPIAAFYKHSGRSIPNQAESGELHDRRARIRSHFAFPKLQGLAHMKSGIRISAEHIPIITKTGSRWTQPKFWHRTRVSCLGGLASGSRR